MSSNPSRADRFRAAFNEIEARLRRRLNEDTTPFRKMVATAFNKRWLTVDQHDALLDFAELRNVISHSRYLSGNLMADPAIEAVVCIERIRDLLCSPPRAVTVLGTAVVSRITTHEHIGDALKEIEQNGFSQLPVYDDTGFVGLLTTNGIARWLASQFAAHSGLAEEAPIREVLRYAEQHERADHLPRTATVVQVINTLAPGTSQSQPPIAVIITETGKRTEKPLAIAVVHDLPKLYDSITINVQSSTSKAT